MRTKTRNCNESFYHVNCNFAVVISFVSINAVYVYDTSQQLLEAANALPDLEDLKLNGIKDGGDSANGGNGDNEGNGENSVNGGNGENGENGNINAENVSETPEIIKSGENAIKKPHRYLE